MPRILTVRARARRLGGGPATAPARGPQWLKREPAPDLAPAWRRPAFRAPLTIPIVLDVLPGRPPELRQEIGPRYKARPGSKRWGRGRSTRGPDRPRPHRCPAL